MAEAIDSVMPRPTPAADAPASIADADNVYPIAEGFGVTARVRRMLDALDTLEAVHRSRELAASA